MEETDGARENDSREIMKLKVEIETLNQLLSVQEQVTIKQSNLLGQKLYELQESEELLLESQRLGRIGGWKYIPASGKTVWTEGMFLIYGLAPAKEAPSFEVLARMVHEDDRKIWGEMVAKGKNTGAFQDFQYRIIRPDGQCRWLLAHETIRPATGETPAIFYGTVLDIAERKSMEEALNNTLKESFKSREILASMLEDNNLIRERLEQSMEELKKNQNMLIQSEKLAAIGQLAAGVAHEINNPLGYVGSNLSTLEKYIAGISDILKASEILKTAVKQKNIDEASKAQAQIDELERKLGLTYVLSDLDNLMRESLEGVDRIKKIVTNLRVFSRKDEKQKEPADLNKIIEGVLAIVWNEIKYKAELKKNYGRIPLVGCNSQQIGQVFINMFVNAAQAIKEKGTITVSTRSDADDVYVDIADTGEGMSKDVIDKIFEPFFTTKAQDKGTGLGLSVSHEIIRAHKGSIQFESERGKGTKFTIRLPIIKA
ncbi:MAG: ATP-binding protein [Candidatus Omnitrophica bacterium]|nr:ATP-binding protein [Candidatus Omnitrophota bacterium]